MKIEPVPGDELIEQFAAIEDAIRFAEFPRLIENATDEGVYLWCPRCESNVMDDELVAVDLDVRWNRGYYDPQEDSSVYWFSGADSDYDSTLYYRHINEGDGHAVRLPEGYEEVWT